MLPDVEEQRLHCILLPLLLQPPQEREGEDWRANAMPTRQLLRLGRLTSFLGI